MHSVSCITNSNKFKKLTDIGYQGITVKLGDGPWVHYTILYAFL